MKSLSYDEMSTHQGEFSADLFNRKLSKDAFKHTPALLVPAFMGLVALAIYSRLLLSF
jgi:hypothetical protein